MEFANELEILRGIVDHASDQNKDFCCCCRKIDEIGTMRVCETCSLTFCFECQDEFLIDNSGALDDYEAIICIFCNGGN